jgi:hypothetical protein
MNELNQKKIGWVFFLLTCLSIVMNYIMAYFPPSNSDIGGMASFMVIPLFVVTAIFLYSAYDK